MTRRFTTLFLFTVSAVTYVWSATAQRAQALLHHPPTTNVKLSLASGHPRLVFRPSGVHRQGRTFEEVRALYRSDKTFQAIFDKALAQDLKTQHPAMLAVCWIVTREDRYAEAAVEKMLSQRLRRSNEPSYSLIWSHALAYDWLYHHPALTKEKRETILTRWTPLGGFFIEIGRDALYRVCHVGNGKKAISF